VLAIAEVLQTARAVAPDGEVRNLTTQVTEPLPEQAGKGQRLASVDVPKVLVVLGEATTTFHLDPIDQSRWLAETVVGGKRVRVAVVYGAGSVVEEITRARAAAGLPAPARPAQPGHLTFGGKP
jgi:hypothetical protein